MAASARVVIIVRLFSATTEGFNFGSGDVWTLVGSDATEGARSHHDPDARCQATPTIPAGLAPATPGNHFKAEFSPAEDATVFRRIARHADWLGVLKRCAVKMDDFPPCGREYSKRIEL